MHEISDAYAETKLLTNGLQNFIALELEGHASSKAISLQ